MKYNCGRTVTDNPGSVSAMRETFVTAGPERIFVRDAGEGSPVVFIHAGVADSRMWLPQLQAVPDGYRYVAQDERGFGHTEVGDTQFSSYRDVLTVMDSLDIATTVLVGCSMGGGVALDVAIVAPQRVSGLVLVGAASPGLEVDPYEPPEWPEAVKAFKAGDLDRVAELDASMWLAVYGRDLDAVDPGLVEVFVEMDLTALRNEAKLDGLRAPGPDRVAGIQEIQKPTLVVVGEHDLPDIREAADHLASRLSDPPAVVVRDAAHLVGFEQPDAFNDALVEFLKTIDR
jgi:pimeloyl-ACP methyl ester carboxylesterase